MREAVARAEKGQIDILFRRGDRACFVYGFAKSQLANIDDDEGKYFKEAAKHVLALTEKQLAELLNEQKVSN